MSEVKCKEWGFLAVRDMYKPTEIQEALYTCRETGRQLAYNGMMKPAHMFCYINVRELRPGGQNAESLALIGDAIDCDQFTPWHKGKTPKEHEDMVLLQEVDRRNRDAREEDRRLADQRRDEDKRWQQQLESLYEKRHRELRRDGRRCCS